MNQIPQTPDVSVANILANSSTQRQQLPQKTNVTELLKSTFNEKQLLILD